MVLMARRVMSNRGKVPGLKYRLTWMEAEHDRAGDGIAPIDASRSRFIAALSGFLLNQVKRVHEHCANNALPDNFLLSKVSQDVEKSQKRTNNGWPNSGGKIRFKRR